MVDVDIVMKRHVYLSSLHLVHNEGDIKTTPWNSIHICQIERHLSTDDYLS